MEAFSIASAVVSVILGIYAIWLSVVFYRMSTESSNKVQESAKDLSSSVAKLEKLFEHLYSDTFSMMRDTYSDMRRHVWPELAKDESGIADQIEARADDKIDVIRTDIMRQIEDIAMKIGGAEAKTDLLRQELSPLLDQAIERSRNAESEAQEETLRDAIINAVRNSGRSGIEAVELLRVLLDKDMSWSQKWGPELRKLRDEGVVKYDNPSGSGPPTKADERVIYVRDSRHRNAHRNPTSELTD